MNEASSEARKRIASATSSARRSGPSGACARSRRYTPARRVLPAGVTRSVRIVPGATALTRMPWSAHSIARCFVSPGGDELGRPVGRLPLLSGDSRDRGETDDRAAACLQHRLDRVLAGQEHPAAIDGHDLVPVLRGGLDDRPKRDDSCVRHQDVEPPVVSTAASVMRLASSGFETSPTTMTSSPPRAATRSRSRSAPRRRCRLRRSAPPQPRTARPSLGRCPSRRL